MTLSESLEKGWQIMQERGITQMRGQEFDDEDHPTQCCALGAIILSGDPAWELQEKVETPDGLGLWDEVIWEINDRWWTIENGNIVQVPDDRSGIDFEPIPEIIQMLKSVGK